jgi:SPP1 family phage portal protein
VYISDLDRINARLAIEGKQNQSDIIKLILNDFSVDAKTRFMAVGERYYQGEHDILKHSFQTSQVYDTVDDPDNPGKAKDIISTVTNKNNSNMHNIHPFHRLLVDQKVGYAVGKPPTISVDGDKAFETAITDRTGDEDFSDMLVDWGKEASNKGIGWAHPYYNPDGSFAYDIIPAGEVIPFYDSEHQRTLEDVVRFYTFDVVKNSQTTKRYKIEWWTANDVTYYVEDEQGRYLLDASYPTNPAPHWWNVTSVDGMERSREDMSWGRVPFIPLHNNSEDTSDLGGQDGDGQPKSIKSLIDAYDMISSATTNNQIDLVELYWVIQGYGGEVAAQIAKKLQINKAVTVEGGENGNVTAQQVTLSVEERCKWLDMLRHDIYHFGMGIDTSDEQLGNNPSGVALKFKYTQLDLKANPLILKLKKALKELFWFITEDINRKQGTQFDSSKIKVTINKTMITNDNETVQMIMQSRGLVPDKTLLAAHPLVDDVNQAMKDLEEQQQKQDERRSKIFGNDDVPPGDAGGQNAGSE